MSGLHQQSMTQKPPPKSLMGDPSHPFPIGTEYYRAPMPPQKFWDEDFAAIRAAGMRIVRTFSFWNWMEPNPGEYELDDFDQMFELAEKHDLKVWFDITLATHGSCPEWMLLKHPEIRVVKANGEVAMPTASRAMPQGAQIHCYDHPIWREYGEGLLRALVSRYKNAPNLIMWGIWDGVSPSGLDGYPCYCRNTIDRYLGWLKKNYSLDELNDKFLRRHRRWEDVQPPRNYNNIVEMLLYRQFHYENLAEALRWQVEVVESMDDQHEVRAHGAHYPRPWDEVCSREVDSYGMSMPSNNLLTSDDPYQISDRYFSFDWNRSIGKNGRWWNEEIYSGMSPAGVTWNKQSDPAELTSLLWMTLVSGAAGCMFWQYTPEYMSFEAPGYSLVSPDRSPTTRLEAVITAIAGIDSLKEYLPIEIPKAEAAVVYSPKSHEIFTYGGENERYPKDLRGVYRTLWENSIPMDVITPSMDWSGYKVIYLPNVALLDEETIARIRESIEDPNGAHLVADGNFGSYVGTGYNSFAPPEGLTDLIDAGVADYSKVTDRDIRTGKSVLETGYGDIAITSECGYSVIRPRGGTRPIATLENQILGVETNERKLTWFGLSLSAAFGDLGTPDLILPLFNSFGISPPIELSGDKLIAMRRPSKLGGWLAFLFNLEFKTAETKVNFKCTVSEATDLLQRESLSISENVCQVKVDPGAVKVIYYT